MANCLQFSKEAYENPAIASISKTRALLSELLAIKLLKEFTNRELVRTYSGLAALRRSVVLTVGMRRSMP
jgi:hypothetical protein